MSLFKRSSGILLHPTSLPGRYGIGDLGDWAYHFVNWLAAHDQGIWQVLPLGPTSYGDSPYQTLSAFAGNPLLISLDRLVEAGWLKAEDLADAPDFPQGHVDYGPVIEYQNAKLRLAYERFDHNGSAHATKAFEDWCAQNTPWLDDYALFIALKGLNAGRPWVEWPEPLALRDPGALDQARAEHASLIREHQWLQWVFDTQWSAVKQYANDKGIRLFGDLPIFVAHDSADVWANRDLFYLDEKGQPTVIAGVPPDYFSETGQRWGNPLYRWDRMREDGYAWWIKRFRAVLRTVDFVRIDHFRGFEAYWRFPPRKRPPSTGSGFPARRAFLRGGAARAGRPADHRRGPGRDHARGRGAARAVRSAGHEGAPVRLEQADQPLPAHNHVVNCVVYCGRTTTTRRSAGGRRRWTTAPARS